ncbi:ABC transporter permease subunit [soil metagenome]
MTATTVRDHARIDGLGSLVRRPPAWLLGAAVLAVWIAAWAGLRGTDTLTLPGLGRTGLHDWFTGLKADLIDSRDSNVLMRATGVLADLVASIGGWLQELVVQPAFPRPVPQIGWLGVVAVAAWLSYAAAGWRIAVLVTGSFLAFGYLGYWEDSLDTLIVTFFAVGIALLVGLPLAVWMATSKTVTTLLTPVLDVLQTVPAFIYLLPLTLFFGIGLPAAVAATFLYALAPVVRIAAHGIRSVATTTIEATDSLGQTGRQRLQRVQLPMAKKTIIVGINQTVMAALSMATIAAFVDGPGLGQPVLRALSAQQVGTAFVAGLCIVVMAVMLDRTTTAASERAELVARAGGRDVRRHRIVLAAGGAVALVLVYLSRTYLWAAEFPETDLGGSLAAGVQSGADWVTSTFDVLTSGVKNQVTALLLNPLQDLLANSPWWLAGAALAALALVFGGVRGCLTAVACLAGIYLTDLWNDSMVTLTMVLVATLLVMLIAVVLGVWMARRQRVDTALRPVLDAGQTMPPFVYLIPALLLFGPTRFTAIVAAVIYAAPIAIKLVADGVKGVSPTTVEAATAAGSTPWQVITRVQLPMARGGLVLAANQGLLYVLSMTVIGGLVGAGALGYDSVLGFSQGEFFGKGIAAGAAIVFLGIMLDRVTRRAAERTGAGIR